MSLFDKTIEEQETLNLIHWMVKHSDNNSLIATMIGAYESGAYGILRAFIEAGLDVNIRHTSQDIPLLTHLVKDNRDISIEVVDYFVKHGANINKNFGGYSILAYAMYNGNYILVHYLLDQGAKTDVMLLPSTPIVGSYTGSAYKFAACSLVSPHLIEILISHHVKATQDDLRTIHNFEEKYVSYKGKFSERMAQLKE